MGLKWFGKGWFLVFKFFEVIFYLKRKEKFEVLIISERPCLTVGVYDESFFLSYCRLFFINVE